MTLCRRKQLSQRLALPQLDRCDGSRAALGTGHRPQSSSLRNLVRVAEAHLRRFQDQSLRVRGCTAATPCQNLSDH